MLMAVAAVGVAVSPRLHLQAGVVLIALLPIVAGFLFAPQQAFNGRVGRAAGSPFVGALGNWVPLQETYDCFYFVADWHALTSDFADTSALTSNVYDNVADWIGAGLDPDHELVHGQRIPRRLALHDDLVLEDAGDGIDGAEQY